jgi:hypothetical protein
MTRVCVVRLALNLRQIWCGAAAIAVGAMVVGAVPAAASVARVGVLSAGPGAVVGGVSASGPTVVAALEGASASSGRVLVFTEPAGGWPASANPAATLTDPEAASELASPSVSGSTVLAGAVNAAGVGYNDVFVEPAGGWSGVVQPAARLVAPVRLGPGVVSGTTIVAPPAVPFEHVSGNVSYVFVEPPGGWSGEIGPAATLSDPRSYSVASPVAISGHTIFAAEMGPPVHGSDLVDAFTEPAGGWSGVVEPSATLPGGYAAVDPAGSLLADNAAIFASASGAWTGYPQASAYLVALPLTSESTVVAFDGRFAAMGGSPFQDVNECPCVQHVVVFREPMGGWAGSVVSSSAITTTTATDEPSLALSGSTMFAADSGVIDVEDVSGAQGRVVPPPRVADATVRGLARARPTLSFVLITAPGALTPDFVSITLPRSLVLARNGRQHRVIVSGVRRSIVEGFYGDRLVLSLTGAGRRVAITIASAAVRETKAAVRAARHARPGPGSKLRAIVTVDESFTGASQRTIVSFHGG